MKDLPDTPHTLWAVTPTSLFQVFAGGGRESVYPAVRLVALRPGHEFHVREGKWLPGGPCIEIGLEGITPFTPRDGKRPVRTNAKIVGGSTPPLVGLFIRKGDAMRCFESGDEDSTNWISFTAEAVRAIRNHHHVFHVSDELRQFAQPMTA